MAANFSGRQDPSPTPDAMATNGGQEAVMIARLRAMATEGNGQDRLSGRASPKASNDGSAN
eukprot:10478787-Prorocentrum_lima.AAC.1